MIQAMHEVNLYSRIDGSGYRNSDANTGEGRAA